MAAQEDMKVSTERRGKAHALSAPDQPVKFFRIPVLSLTIGVGVCYDPQLSLFD